MISTQSVLVNGTFFLKIALSVTTKEVSGQMAGLLIFAASL